MSRHNVATLLKELHVVIDDMNHNWRNNAAGRLHIIYTQLDEWSRDGSGLSLKESAKNLTLLDSLWSEED